jgi:hypothetical protein
MQFAQCQQKMALGPQISSDVAITRDVTSVLAILWLRLSQTFNPLVGWYYGTNVVIAEAPHAARQCVSET